MKNRIKSIMAFGLVAAVATAAVIFFAPVQSEQALAQSPVAADAPTVTVSGTGSITVAPDIATVTLGVETRHANAQTAIEQNTNTMNNVFAAIVAMGISEDDIATRHFSLHQNFNWTATGNRINDGYSVSNTLSITVRNLDDVGAVIGTAVSAGANVSHGIQFSIEDASGVYLQALAVAVRDAAAKGNAIAAALGTSIASVVSVIETNTWAAPTSWGDFDMAMVASQDSYAGGVHVPIHAADLTITARVNVVYALTR